MEVAIHGLKFYFFGPLGLIRASLDFYDIHARPNNSSSPWGSSAMRNHDQVMVETEPPFESFA